MSISKGDTVKQALPAPIEGTVVGFQIDQEHGTRLILVEWQDGEEVRSRYFNEDEIAPV